MSSPEDSNKQSPAVTERRRNLARDTIAEAMDFVGGRGPLLRHVLSQTSQTAVDVETAQTKLVMRLKDLSKKFDALEFNAADFKIDSPVAREFEHLLEDHSISKEAGVIRDRIGTVANPQLLSRHYRADGSGLLRANQWNLGSSDGFHLRESMAELFGANAKRVSDAFELVTHEANRVAAELNSRTRTRFVTKAGARRRGERNSSKLEHRLSKSSRIEAASQFLEAAYKASGEGARASRRNQLLRSTEEIGYAKEAFSRLRVQTGKLETIRRQWDAYFSTQAGAAKASELGINTEDAVKAALELTDLADGNEYLTHQQFTARSISVHSIGLQR